MNAYCTRQELYLSFMLMTDKSQFEGLYQAFTNEFEVEKKFFLEQFLGMKFTKDVNKIHITQKHLIEQIIKDVDLHDKNGKSPKTPTKSSSILQRYEHEESHNEKRFYYRSVIGK